MLVAQRPQLGQPCGDDEPGGGGQDCDPACGTGQHCSGGDCVADSTGCTSDSACVAQNTDCETFTCDTASGECVGADVADGTTCDDGAFCTDIDTCTTGECGGTARDCSGAGDACNDGVCDETSDACVPAALPDDSVCDDGATCTGPDSCQSGACVGAADDLLCGLGEICNLDSYPGATGCGAAPDALTLTCDDQAAASAACTIGLSAAAVPILAEGGHLSCSVAPAPAVLFEDNFDDSVLDLPWENATSVGAFPLISTTPVLAFESTAAGVPQTWAAEIVVPTAGLSVVCVDFDAAQTAADANESITVLAALESPPDVPPAPAAILDLDFGTWGSAAAMDPGTVSFNRNACLSITSGTQARVRFELASDDPGSLVYIDNVRITGLAAAYTDLADEGFTALPNTTGWTQTVNNGAVGLGNPTATNSLLLAGGDDFTISRNLDATACDVLDVDFDFGFGGSPDNEVVALNIDTGGGGVTIASLLGSTWDNGGALLPWFGLRRITDAVPSARHSATVALSFDVLAAGGGGDSTYLDNVEARCADLPDPTPGAITDNEDGTYSLTVDATAPVDAVVSCTWTSGALTAQTGSGNVAFRP